jgi:hypothetical protein
MFFKRKEEDKSKERDLIKDCVWDAAIITKALLLKNLIPITLRKHGTEDVLQTDCTHEENGEN